MLIEKELSITCVCLNNPIYEKEERHRGDVGQSIIQYKWQHCSELGFILSKEIICLAIKISLKMLICSFVPSICLSPWVLKYSIILLSFKYDLPSSLLIPIWKNGIFLPSANLMEKLDQHCVYFPLLHMQFYNCLFFLLPLSNAMKFIKSSVPT